MFASSSFVTNPRSNRLSAALLLAFVLAALPSLQGRPAADAPETAIAEAYIRKYLNFAIEARRVANIPIAVKLAQGMLESDYGRSELATDANNHFAIKCKENWKGFRHDYKPSGYKREVCFRKYETARASYQDHSALLSRSYYDAVRALPASNYKGWAKGLKDAGYATDENYAAKLINLIERLELYKYDADYEAAYEHEIADNTLTGNQIVIRHLANRKAEQEHTKRVIEEMKRDQAEIRKDMREMEGRNVQYFKTLEQRLAEVEQGLAQKDKELQTQGEEIESLRRGQLHLQQRQSDAEDAEALKNGDPFHTAGMPAFPEGPRFPQQRVDARGVFYINEREAIAADGKRCLLEYAYDFERDHDELMRYNDLEKDVVFPKGYYIFLQAKRSSNDMAPDTHTVERGETMHSIAARYGVRLQRLLMRNNLSDGEEPQENEHIFINSKNPNKPVVKSAPQVGDQQRFIRPMR